MSTNTISPNMSLTVPTVGQEPGPQYATDVSGDLNIIDSHDHTAGKGVQVPSNGININQDLSFNSHNETGLRSTRFISNGSVLSGVGDIGCLYDVNGDLYWNDGSGTAVQLTSGAAIPSSVGGYTQVLTSANLTINSAANTVLVSANSTSNTIAVTLPLANSVAAGRFYIVKDRLGTSQTHNITIDPAGSDTIDGVSNFVLRDNHVAIGVVSDGISNWMLLPYDRKVYFGETLLVKNDSTLVIDATSTLSVAGTFTAATLVVSSDLSVTGTTELTGKLTAGVVETTGAMVCDTTLGVAGNSLLNTVEAVGAVHCDSTLSVTGNTLVGHLEAAGPSVCDSTLAVTGAATFSNNILANDHVVLGASSDIILSSTSTIGYTSPTNFTKTFAFYEVPINGNYVNWITSGQAELAQTLIVGGGTPCGRLVSNILVPNGVVISSVVVWIKGAAGHVTMTGVTTPVISFSSINIQTSSTTAIINSLSDSTASAVLYEATHNFGQSGLSNIVDNTQNLYQVILTGEAGANWKAGLQVNGVQVTYVLTTNNLGGN